MAPSPIAMMLKHWKKSIVYVPVSGGALAYIYDRQMTNDVMRNSCKRAARWGDQRLRDPTASTRHITVILNPVACKRKSKKLYTKWVEPILHLAGIKVSVIETQSPKQAFDLMKIMSNCDGVAIVGGDGTVNEAINGLLNRSDSARAVKEFPIGIIPAGQNNSIARYVHQNNISYRNQKEFLIQSTLRLVECATENFDVLKITPMDAEKRDGEQPTYALRDIRFGKYQSNIFKVSGYMLYQTYLKPVWIRIHSLFSSKYTSPKIHSVSYTSPCAGCSRCLARHKIVNVGFNNSENNKNANRRWWGILAPVPNQGPSEQEKKDMELAKVDNPECDRWMRVEGVSDVTDFRATMMGDKMVRLSLSRHGEYTPSEVIETQDIRLKVDPDLDRAKEETELKKLETVTDSPTGADADKKTDNEEHKDKIVEFLIDGQPKQAQSIEITSLDQVLTVFTGPYYAPLKTMQQQNVN